MEIIALSVFGLAILALAAYGYKISAKTAEDYMLAGRTIGVVVMFFFILFAISSSWTFYGYPGFIYLNGPAYIYFIWGSVAGFAALYMFLGPRLWAIARINRFLSPVELLSERYESPFLRILLSIMLLAFIVPYVGIQPLGVGLGFQALTGMPLMVGALYTVALLIILVLLGGMRIVAWVNIFLGAVYASALLGSIIWIVNRFIPGGLRGAVEFLKINNPAMLSAPGPQGYFTPVIIGGTMVVGLMAFSWPHIVIGVMTARDKMLFKWFPLLIFIFGGLFFYTMPFIWGSLIAPVVMPGVVGKAAADNIVQTIITTHLPRWFSVYVLMGVIAAAISTAAVQLMTSSVIVARDLIQGFIKPDATDKQIIGWARLSVIGIVILSLGVSLWNPTAMALYLTDVTIPGFAQWGPALVGGILWKRGTKQGAIVSTLVGVVYLIAGLIYRPLFAGFHPVMPTIIVNMVLYIVISFLTKRPSEEIQSRFFDEVDEFLEA
ncbi:MAG TPA: sodium:solute symporter family protein [Spirochaetes bacterium]|nr:sodium:solute symporter family protein [Spirochaetota bacterium]